jgi:hypothetical protein
MYDEILKRDQNSAVVLGGVTDDAYQSIRMLRVDPVTGRLLISATGGSGGSSGYQEPTGSPSPPVVVDGVNTIFTFATAPKALVVDNNNLMKLQQDGTPNWSGTTTITLEVAPNNYIYAVA